MSKKILDALQETDENKIKQSMFLALSEKLTEKIKEIKPELAKIVVTEAGVVDDTQTSDLPAGKKDNRPPIGSTKIVKFQSKPGHYIYQFPFMGKRINVNFEPLDNSNTRYRAYFNAKGMEKSDKPSVRLGISQPTQITQIFMHVLKTVEQFMAFKKPSMIRFQAGEGIQFPPMSYSLMYPFLKDFAALPAIKKAYTVLRGDAIKDGAAFIIRRGAQQSNLKSKSWKPQMPQKEEIANVSGAAVATDRPIKPPLGFPGLAMARRKK
jgi:hypothetical protein